LQFAQKVISVVGEFVEYAVGALCDARFVLLLIRLVLALIVALLDATLKVLYRELDVIVGGGDGMLALLIAPLN